MNKKLLLTLVMSLLALNSAYLYLFDSPSLFYILNIFLHLAAGTAVIVLLAFLARSLKELSWHGKTSLGLLGVTALLGIFLFFSGTIRPYQNVLFAHMLLGVLALLALLAHLIASKEAWPLLGAAILGSLLLPLLVKSAGWNDPYSIQNPTIVPLSMADEGAGSDSPFFPSSANTNVNTTIPSDFFMNSETCGKVGCHPDIFEQWSTSAHHIASFNNQWYRKSIEYMQDVVGTEPSKWCGGCHDHAVFFNGMMDQPIKDQIHRPEAKAGLTCTSCHSIVAVRSTMGNGSFVIEYPPLHDLATSENPLLEYLHDFIVELDPGPHRETFIKPFIKEQTSEYCSGCHKVHLDKPVNDYRWLRGFNEYDGWQSSGVSGQGARSFYYPDSPKDCVDCHMPLVASSDAGNIEGAVHDHRFPGANTALPYVNGFDEQLKLVTDFLQNDQVSVDIFALSEVSEEEERAVPVTSQQSMQTASTFAEGDELGIAVSGRGAGYTEVQEVLAPIDRVVPVVHRGETIRVDVVVRTLGVGHFFPGGTVDAFDVWVELKAEDENGKAIFWSGYVPEDGEGRKGPVDPSAHFYRSRMLDGEGNPINKRNAWATRSVAYVRLIPPGAADTVHYRLQIPEDVGDEIHLTARVNYRKFSWWTTQWAYAGVRDPKDLNPEVTSGYDNGKWVFTGDTSDVSGEMKEIPDLPITTMAESTTQLRVVDSKDEVPSQSSHYDREDLIRWNDYGIGLLLQGDLRAAEQIFTRVTEIDPDFADGWVNIGRARIQEGRTEEAQSVLLEALKRDQGLAKTHFFLGMTYKNQGNYEKALEHFWTAEDQYPRDRVVLNQIGRILFLQRNFSEAVEIFNRVLEIDPEDLQAHYNLMLCFRALRDTERAQHQQALYLRFKADESAQSNLGDFLQNHPHDNNERQAIHEHGTYPLDTERTPTASSASAY